MVLSSLLRNMGYVFIMPVALRTIEPQHLGLWYVLVALGGLSTLADLGFSQTVGRFAVALTSGEGWVSKFGIASPTTEGAVRLNFRSFINAAKKIHMSAALVSTLILLAAAQVTYFADKQSSAHGWQTQAAFWMFLVTTAYSVYSKWLPSVLTGLQEVTYVAKQTVLGTLAYLVVTTCALVLDGGIVALALGQAVQPLLTNFRLNSRMHERTACFPNDGGRDESRILSVLWPNSWRVGVVMLGAYLINNANILIASRFLTLEETASYGLSMQLFTILTTIAYMLVQARMPEISALRQVPNIAAICPLFGRQLIFALGIFILGSSVILLVGDLCLILIKSQTSLLPPTILAFMAVYRLLEFHHGAFAMLVMSGNRVPFVLPSIVSGACIIVLSLWLAPISGVWGLLIAVAGVQALFNNWWPVKLGLETIDSSFRSVWSKGFGYLVSSIR